MLKKVCAVGGTFAAGLALGFGVSELAKVFREHKMKEEQENNEEEEEIFEEDFEEEEQHPDTNAQISPEKACAVFFVRKDLKMRNGKIAAQCGHAALGIFKKTSKVFPKIAAYWYDNKFNKKFFCIHSEEQMDEFLHFADDNGLLYTKIRDAGRTQIQAGSATVLAIGPVDEDIVDTFTSGLTPL